MNVHDRLEALKVDENIKVFEDFVGACARSRERFRHTRYAQEPLMRVVLLLYFAVWCGVERRLKRGKASALGRGGSARIERFATPQARASASTALRSRIATRATRAASSPSGGSSCPSPCGTSLRGPPSLSRPSSLSSSSPSVRGGPPAHVCIRHISAPSPAVRCAGQAACGADPVLSAFPPAVCPAPLRPLRRRRDRRAARGALRHSSSGADVREDPSEHAGDRGALGDDQEHNLPPHWDDAARVERRRAGAARAQREHARAS